MGDGWILSRMWVRVPGAFCSSPHGSHPYILMSWTGKMGDLFTLAHELGHAGHFYLAHQEQKYL